jgi:hypothetical protein
LTREERKDLFNAAETVRKLRLSVPHAYTLAATGSLPFIKFEKAVRFDPGGRGGVHPRHRRDKGKEV